MTVLVEWLKLSELEPSQNASHRLAEIRTPKEKERGRENRVWFDRSWKISSVGNLPDVLGIWNLNCWKMRRGFAPRTDFFWGIFYCWLTGIYKMQPTSRWPLCPPLAYEMLQCSFSFVVVPTEAGVNRREGSPIFSKCSAGANPKVLALILWYLENIKHKRYPSKLGMSQNS